MRASGHDLRIYLAGAALSYIGTAIVPVALSFAVLGGGHGANAVGAVLAAQTIPTVLFVLFGGVAGDRSSRRRIMIGADALRALAQASLAACLLDGRAPLILMMIAAAAVGVGTAFFQPASAGFLTEIVQKTQLARANGLLRLCNALAMMIGPALGGVLVAGAGPGWGIAADAASYVASASCLIAIGHPAGVVSSTQPAKSVRRELIAAFRTLRHTRWLLLIVAQYAALNLLVIAPFNVIAPTVLSAASLGPGGGAGAWGTVLASIGAGAILGATASARYQPRRLLLGVEAAATMLAVPLFLLAFHAPFAAVAAGSVIFGIGAAMLSVLTLTAIQREVEPTMLSRIMAIVQLANIGLLPLGYLMAGPVMGLAGASTSLASSGLCAVLSVATLCGQPEIRRFEIFPAS